MSCNDERLEQLTEWVASQLQLPRQTLDSVSGDASFRRYFRRPEIDDMHSLIAVDAPPEKESLREFVAVSQLFKSAEVNVPQVHYVDFSTGFMLLTDFGDQLMLNALTHSDVNGHSNSLPNEQYTHAIDALIKIQSIPEGQSNQLAVYDKQLLMQEMQLFPDWLLQRHLGLNLSKDENDLIQHLFVQLAEVALAQPQVVVHRDFHSRNLLITPENSPGVIDYQDAVIGPVTYDLVSLLKDCYISWPREQQLQWLDYYRTKATKAGLQIPEREKFVQDWDWMGAQRHLKAAGIFARLYHRDSKSGYLPDIPRTMQYLVDVMTRYSEFSDLAQWFNKRIKPAFENAGLDWQGVS